MRMNMQTGAADDHLYLLDSAHSNSLLYPGKAGKIFFNRDVLIPESDKLVGPNLADDLDAAKNTGGLIKKIFSAV